MSSKRKGKATMKFSKDGKKLAESVGGRVYCLKSVLDVLGFEAVMDLSAVLKSKEKKGVYQIKEHPIRLLVGEVNFGLTDRDSRLDK